VSVRRAKRPRPGIDFRVVVDALPGLVLITQADGRSVVVNKGWRDYTGAAEGEAPGHAWQASIHPDDRTRVLESWEAMKRSGAVGEIDARLRRFDGEYRWCVLRPAPLPRVGRRRQSWSWLALEVDQAATLDGRLRRALDMLPIQAGFLTPAGLLEFSNLKALDDFGMTFEELRAPSTSGIIHDEDIWVSDASLANLLATGRWDENETRFRYKDGSYRWTRARVLPCHDAHGNLVRYVTCQIDVDDLKRAEALLAAEVALLEMVARGEPLRQVLDALSRNVEQLSEGCFCSVLLVAPDRRHFELGAGPSLPDAYNAILHGKPIDGADGPGSLAVLQKVQVIAADLASDPRWAASPWPEQMHRFGYGSCWSKPVMSASGDASGVVTIHRRDPVGPTPQELDLVDRFTKIAGIAIDRAQADAALQTSERELREALAQLTEGQRLSKTGSFTSDIRPDLQRWSAELYRIYEIDPDTPPAMDAVRERVHPDDLALFNAEIQHRLEGRESDFVFRIVTPSGRLKHLHAVARLMDKVAGRPIFMGAVQDITESKLAEEALAQSRSELAHVARVATLNAMTASIAHEVSQPIAGVLTNANTCVRMLAADPPNLVGAAETVRRTIRDANRATEVIRRLRAMFSTKAPSPEIADLNELAQDVIALSAGELRRSGAILQTDLGPDLPPVSVDRVQLQQVILNLLLNAADAMSAVEGRPRMLRVQTRRDEDGSVRLAVRDSGVGLDPISAEKLFDAFFTTKPQGMGVGLSISRSIIERHDGRLWAEPNEGPGATFCFCLPSAFPLTGGASGSSRGTRRHLNS
jgi:PAS domain S-box-containing protein